jgi:hypothetical protein
LRGLQECALRTAIATGQIKAEADNTIDAAKADAMWDASTDPTKLRCTYARGLGRGTAARATAVAVFLRLAFAAVAETLTEAGADPSSLSDFPRGWIKFICVF